MAAPIIISVKQFLDADGHPYAGGTLASYLPGTTTAKPTYVDPGLSALNTNPVVLDAAGRCILYGDGDFRLILRDAAGNLIWDQQATTLVSAAMMPFVSAPTIADAKHLLGIDTDIAAEASARAAADSTEQSARIAADNTLQANINAEVTRAEAAEANLQTQVDALTGSGSTVATSVQSGYGTTSSGGTASVTFGTAYTSTPAVCATVVGTALIDTWLAISATSTGFNIIASQPYAGGSTVIGVPCGFCWIAAGT